MRHFDHTDYSKSLKNFQVMPLILTIVDFHCLIHMLYLVVVLLRIDVFRILTVVPLLPWQSVAMIGY